MSTEHANVRSTLQAVDESIVVPTHDVAGVTALARRIRRRRRRGAVVATAGVVAVAGLGLGLLGGVGPGAPPGRDSDPAAAVDRPVAVDGAVPVVLDGAVRLVSADGAVTQTGRRGAVVGVTGGRVVVLDGTRLVMADGSEVEGVETAFTDPRGVTFQRSDGRVERVGGGGVDTSAATGRLVGASADGFAMRTSDGVVLHDASGAHPVTLGGARRARAADVHVAGDTAVLVDRGAGSAHRLDGTWRAAYFLGSAGALSSDGERYASASTSEDISRKGGASRLTIHDIDDGSSLQPLPGPVLDLAWYGGVLYVVTDTGAARTLSACDDACTERFVDRTDTLRLH